MPAGCARLEYVMKTRRMAVALAIISALFLHLTLNAHGSIQTANDVPMFRGNPARTGEMPGPGPGATPEVQWAFETDAGGKSRRGGR